MLPGRGNQTSGSQEVQGELSETDNELPQARATLATAAFSRTEVHTVKADADLMEGRPPEAATEFMVPEEG